MADPRHPTVPGAPVAHLLPGEYLIQVKSSGLYLAAEDAKPLLPKKVYTLPHGTLAPKWTVEVIDDRRYYIKLSSAPTVSVDGKVYAIQVWQPMPEHQIWVLDNRPQQGANVYTISDAKGATSWVMEHSAPYTQVTMKDIGVFIPEHPPLESLFVFTRVH